MDSQDIDNQVVHKYNTRSKAKNNKNNIDTTFKTKAKRQRILSPIDKDNEFNTKPSNTLLDASNTNIQTNHTQENNNNISMETNKQYIEIDMSKLLPITFPLYRKVQNKRKRDYNEIKRLFLDDEDDYETSDDTDECMSDIEDLPSDIEYNDEEFKYIKSLDKEKQKEIIEIEKRIIKAKNTDIPLRFKILKTNSISDTIKAGIIAKIDQYYNASDFGGEANKLSQWIQHLEKIPFDTFISNPVQNTNTFDEICKYLSNTRKILDDAVYGHDVAKSQILTTIAKEISNGFSTGCAIAIQGPMGNGKTTLVKEGICKALNRPFAFIPLGGMQDAAYLMGHDYTYEGSKPGRIVEILLESKCMNPVIYFDELDKISESSKGEEIANMLCHLTDTSQNKEFYDKYFSGIPFDLSRSIFIFSYNDESKINPILLDRLIKIRTDGFSITDKIKISQNYLLPKILKEYGLKQNDVSITDDTLYSIISNNTDKENGVRNLKRCLEKIVSNINILRYINSTDDITDNKIIDLKIKNFKLPFNVNCDNINMFIDEGHKNNNQSYSMMYL